MASKPKQGDDDRFNRVMKDPRFWEMPERQRKIKIDKRFQAMFHDKQFKLKYTVDKRGRPINHSSTDDLKRFYDLSDSEESDHEDKKLSSKKKVVKSKAKVETEDVQHLVEQNTEKPKTKGKSKSKKEKEATCGTIKCEQLESESPTLEVSIDKLNKKSKAKKVLQSIETEGCSKVEPIQEGQKNILSELKKQKAPENKKLTKLKMKDALSDEDVDGSENEGYGSIEEAESAAELSEDDEDERGQEEEEAESDEDDSDEGSDSEAESDSGPDLARGKGNIETSSEEDEEDDLTDLLRKEDDVEHDWGELWKDAPRGDTVTRRLAVCNMDWDRLKAKDLLALLNSFKPKGGVVLSVKIYPSEFGEQRMQAEQLQGPLELAALPEDPDKDTEQERIYREKMREYQFKRMKYFYAVVDCDSPETASKIYEECDGFEYESSCSFLDLRFIPDDVMFDEEPKDVAADVDLASYTPKYFTSTAMATSKVELTWDETDHERVTALSRTFKKDEILDMDFQAYLASSSEEEEEEEEMEDIVDESEQTANVDDTEQGKASRPKKAHKDDEEQMAKYRELLKSIQEKDKKREDKDMEMEIKWVPGLKETAEQLVKKKLEGKDNLTPWEMFLEKKKEKKKLKKKADLQKVSAEDLSDDELPPDVDIDDPYFAEEFGKAGIGQKKKSKKNKKSKEDERTPEEEAEIEKQKAEMSLLMMDDEDDNKKHFNYDKIVEQQNLSKKKKKKLLKQEELLEEDEFQVDVSDPRFQAMYTSHLFNLDPSEPGFKKTKATQRIVEEKMRRREAQQQSCDDAVQKKERELGEEKEPAKKTLDPGLSMLIKSIKSKTQQFQARKKLKTK